jgi:hypothetical protein
LESAEVAGADEAADLDRERRLEAALQGGAEGGDRLIAEQDEGGEEEGGGDRAHGGVG